MGPGLWLAMGLGLFCMDHWYFVSCHAVYLKHSNVRVEDSGNDATHLPMSPILDKGAGGILPSIQKSELRTLYS